MKKDALFFERLWHIWVDIFQSNQGKFCCSGVTHMECVIYLYSASFIDYYTNPIYLNS